MKSYIFYKTSDGTIVMQKDYKNTESCDINVSLNPGTAYIEGKVGDINAYKVNLSDLTIVSSTSNQYNPPFEDQLRQRRNAELQTCDWTVGADSPLSDSKKAEWQTYRNALRDLPDTTSATIYSDIVWPIKPN